MHKNKLVYGWIRGGEGAPQIVERETLLETSSKFYYISTHGYANYCYNINTSYNGYYTWQSQNNNGFARLVGPFQINFVI